MFDDPKEELRRLQQRLLEEEDREEPDPDADWLANAQDFLGDDPDDEEEEPEAIPVRYYANGYGKARNRDKADLDLEEYSEAVYRAPGKRGTGCLVTVICLELLGIAAVALYWYLVLK